MKGKLPNVWVSFEPLRISTEHFWASHRYTPAKPAEPPACRWKPEITGSTYYWISGEGRSRCIIPDSGKCPYCSGEIQTAEPQSEPLKWNSEGLAEAPGMRYCTMYGSMFLYIDGKSQGVLISTASDEASRRKAAEEDFRSRMVPPQSEPPIADGVGVGIANLFMGHEAETAGKVLARAYLSLKAERDALRAENAAKYEEIASERHSYILLEAERQRLYDGNAALKARVEELEGVILRANAGRFNGSVIGTGASAIRARQLEELLLEWADHGSGDGLLRELQNIKARKEQEASNDK